MFGAFFLPGNAINRLGPGNYVAAPPLSGLAEAVAVTRLACVALAILGACAIARRFFRRDADLVSQLLLAGIVANLAAYIPSSLADHTALNAREFAPVLPFAAVLAARTLGDRLGDAGDRRQPGHSAAVAGAGRAAWLVRFRPVARGRHPGRAQPVRQARSVPPAASPDRRHRRVLELQRDHRGHGRRHHHQGRHPGLPPAVRLGVEARLVRPGQAHGELRARVQRRRATSASGWCRPPRCGDLGTLLPAAGRATLDPGAGYTVHAYQGNLLAQLPRLAHC